MSLIQLPELKADLRGVRFNAPREAMARWTPGIHAASDDDASISILDSIGESWDGSGVTAKRVGAALRTIGARDVVVNINSPGGDMFEGVAVYNQLRAHKGKVTVQVLGLAASAASIIAMAGDEILMGDGAFLMIHNAQALVIGNRHDMADAAELLTPFDLTMAKVYASRGNIEVDEAAKLMDAETWLTGDDARAIGLADGAIAREQIEHDDAKAQNRRALAVVDTTLARAGYSRTQRRDFLSELTASTPRAADDGTPRAVDDAALLRGLTTTLTTRTYS